MELISLHGMRMNVISSAKGGVVSSETVFEFEQKQAVVSARYRGGQIIDGYLIGRIEGGILDFRYVQTDDQGNLDSGRSWAEFDRSEDGRLRLVEHFQWATRPGGGTNIFEEISG